MAKLENEMIADACDAEFAHWYVDGVTWKRYAVERAAEPEAKQLLSGVATDDYLWAYATIKSRTAEVLVDGEKANLLAPNFDLFNHSDAVRPGSSHFFDQQRRALVVVAARDYAAGEQAFISYGTGPPCTSCAPRPAPRARLAVW